MYNDAAAPPAPTSYTAQVTPLPGGSQGPPESSIALAGSHVAVGSTLLLDAASARFYPLDGRASFAANTSKIRDAGANGDVFTWLEPGEPPSVHVRDFTEATSARATVPAGMEPTRGSLVVSSLLVAWSYTDGSGRSAVAGFLRADLSPRVFDVDLPGNITARAAVGTDLFIGQADATQRLWVYNVATHRLDLVAKGEGVLDVHAGQAFAAWVNRSVPQTEYFDINARQVETLPGPLGHRPVWVRTSPNAVLTGGFEAGLFGESASAWRYDFATGDGQAISGLHTEEGSTLDFAMAHDAFVVVTSTPLPREPAPYTAHLLGLALVAMIVTVYFGTRDAFQGQD